MTVAKQPDPCDETETWVNRNGTFLRVLIVVDEQSDLPRYPGEVDVSIQRLVVIAACGAHGHHRCLLDRIAVANDARYRP